MQTELPIRDLESIDSIVKNDDGSVCLEITAHGPLTSDIEVQQQLLAKVETYLCYVNSTGYRREYGFPSAKSTAVVVSCSHSVDEEIVQLIERMKSWTKDNNASIQLKDRDA